jgi:hypothetical protein
MHMTGWVRVAESHGTEVLIETITPEKDETLADVWRYCWQVYRDPKYCIQINPQCCVVSKVVKTNGQKQAPSPKHDKRQSNSDLPTGNEGRSRKRSRRDRFDDED